MREYAGGLSIPHHHLMTAVAIHVLSKCAARVVFAYTCCLSEVYWCGVTRHKSCSDTAAAVSCCAAVCKGIGASLAVTDHAEVVASYSQCHTQSCRTHQNARRSWENLQNLVSKAMLRSFLSRDMTQETKHVILVSIHPIELQVLKLSRALLAYPPPRLSR